MSKNRDQLQNEDSLKVFYAFYVTLFILCFIIFCLILFHSYFSDKQTLLFPLFTVVYLFLCKVCISLKIINGNTLLPEINIFLAIISIFGLGYAIGDINIKYLMVFILILYATYLIISLLRWRLIIFSLTCAIISSLAGGFKIIIEGFTFERTSASWPIAVVAMILVMFF